MKKKKKEKYPKKTVVYDAFDSDFVPEVKSKKRIDKDYKYIHKNPLWHIAAFILYRIIVFPIAFIYCKLFLRQRIVGRRKLKGYRSAVLFCQHNEPVGDAMTPSQIAFPKKAYVVIHPDNVSLPVIGGILPMLGGIPTPTDIRGARSFSLAAEELLKKRTCITVYPEAHVWPKCKDVRPFSSSAFDVAVRNRAAAFAVTRVYKRKRIVGYCCRIYIDGPFFADEGLSRGAAASELALRVRSAMIERTKLSDVEIIRYEKETK